MKTNLKENIINTIDNKIMKYDIFIFIKNIIQDIFKYQIIDISAQTAFFFTLSFFPIILFLLTILLNLPIDISAFLQKINDILPSYFLPITKSKPEVNYYFLSISFLTLMWSASTVVYIINKNINKIYNHKKLRNSIVQRFWSLIMNFLFVSSLLLIMISVSLINFLLNFLLGFLPINLYYINLIISVFVFPFALLIMFFIIYYFSVPKPKKIRDFLLGSISSTILIIISFYIFNFYLIKFNPFTSYGILSTVIILLFYFYITSFIIFLGAIINKSFVKWRNNEK